MRFRFQFRRYRLPFRAPVRTAHGLWSEREGVIVRVEGHGSGESEEDNGGVGFGEAAPIPWFGTETVDEVEEACRGIGEWVEDRAFQEVPMRLGCLRNALANAVGGVRRERGSRERFEGQTNQPESDRGSAFSSLDPLPRSSTALAVAALLPAGRAALALISPKAEIGYRVFKWKVGVADVADELALLDDICAELPSGAKLRLDANGAWDRRRAERWLERCGDRPVEFVEQPCFAEASEGAARQRRTEELLLGLAADYPTPIALDESLVGEGDIERWIGSGWPGVFVVKPSLLADVNGAMARLEKAKAKVVFSSALETAVGARAALEVAFAWRGEASLTDSRPPRALGFGVWPLFADARFDGPAVAPFVRMEDIERMSAEAVWTALS